MDAGIIEVVYVIVAFILAVIGRYTVKAAKTKEQQVKRQDMLDTLDKLAELAVNEVEYQANEVASMTRAEKKEKAMQLLLLFIESRIDKKTADTLGTENELVSAAIEKYARSKNAKANGYATLPYVH